MAPHLPATPGEPARDATMVDQDIRRDVADAILDLRMPPGTHLSEESLGKLYHVSRTVARKALYQLASDMLIELRPQRGAIVARPSTRNAREVFAARRIIEVALLDTSVPRMGAREHAVLRELLAQDAAATARNDRRSMIRASGAFHRSLADMAGNAVLGEYLGRLIGRTSLLIATYSHSVTHSCSLHGHQALMTALERGDVAAARELMTRHLHEVEAQLDLTRPRNHGDELAQMLAPAATDA